jgi:hypothetical protein
MGRRWGSRPCGMLTRGLSEAGGVVSEDSEAGSVPARYGAALHAAHPPEQVNDGMTSRGIHISVRSQCTYWIRLTPI